MSITTRFNQELSTVALAYGNAMVNGLRENLIALDKKASGDLINSLSVSVFRTNKYKGENYPCKFKSINYGNNNNTTTN